MDEIFKPIAGYEGFYEVSNLGRVRSLDRIVEHFDGVKRLLKGKFMVPRQDVTYGYMRVSLSKNHCRNLFFVHRLVAQAFIPNQDPEHLTIINHKDEDPSNNRADNLEWCDQKYNINYGTRTAKVIEKLSRPVCGYTNQGEVVIRFKSMDEAELSGYRHSEISNCCHGKGKLHHGLFWCFAEDEDKIVPRPWPVSNYPRPVEAYNDDGVVLCRFESAAEAGRNGFLHGTVTKCCQDKAKTHRGLHWRYA